MLAALMFVSRVLMESLPNIHLIGMLLMTYTLVYRWKALIPLYLYIILDGFYWGFNMYWIPYLYVWAVLWAVTMILPRNMPKWLKCVVYPLVCGLHGLLFGTLFAPAMALLMKLNWGGMLAWIAAGFKFDLIHALGNLVLGTMIVPLSVLLDKLNKTGTQQ